jgi:hypothetical protein
MAALFRKMQWLMASLMAARERYFWLLAIVRRNPALLLVVFIGHIVLSAVAALLALVPMTLILIFSGGDNAFNAADALFTIIFLPLLFTIWLHFIWLNLRSVRANVRISGNRREVSGVLQALLAVIFSFSVLYYYLQLFSDNSAFVGMYPIQFGSDFRSPTTVERLIIVPAWNTVVDCIYFSVVTISTLGYGDIRPDTAVAKLATSAEVITGFILIVLALGSVMSDKVLHDGTPAMPFLEGGPTHKESES